jgi:hypothetical protein
MDAEQFLTQWISLAERKTQILEVLQPQVLNCLDGTAQRILAHTASNKSIDPRMLLEILDTINEQLQSVLFCDGARSTIEKLDDQDRDIAQSALTVHQVIAEGLSQLETISELELRAKLEKAFETLHTSFSDVLEKPGSQADSNGSTTIPQK